MDPCRAPTPESGMEMGMCAGRDGTGCGNKRLRADFPAPTIQTNNAVQPCSDDIVAGEHGSGAAAAAAAPESGDGNDNGVALANTTRWWQLDFTSTVTSLSIITLNSQLHRAACFNCLVSGLFECALFSRSSVRFWRSEPESVSRGDAARRFGLLDLDLDAASGRAPDRIFLKFSNKEKD